MRTEKHSYRSIAFFLSAIFLACNILVLAADEPIAVTVKMDHRNVCQKLPDAIDRAALYLISKIEQDGSFIYISRPWDIKYRSKKYNILRHAGAMYALSMAHQRKPSDALKAGIVKAAKYLVKETAPLVGKPDCIAVWSRANELSRSENNMPKQAKLGAAGISLLALCHAEKIAPGTVSFDLLKGLGRFILFMQKEDGSFYSKYYEGSGPDLKFNSLYYPGEAMFGLACLYEIDKGAQWLESAIRGMRYLAAARDGKTKIPPDHWALIATERILFGLDKSGLEDREKIRLELFKHSGSISISIIMAQLDKDVFGNIKGAFSLDGRTCPVATRLEGILAAASYLPEGQGQLKKRIMESATLGMGYILSCQHNDGGISKGNYKIEIAGQTRFNPAMAEVRIDYVQHALSAMIMLEKLSTTPFP